MDSSQSQHSNHPASGSDCRSHDGSGDHSLTRSTSGSGSSDSEPMPMSSSDVGSNSARSTSIPSVGNTSSENPPSNESESSGSLKTITSTDFEPDQEEDVNVDSMNQSTPSDQEQHAIASPNAQETMMDTAAAASSSGGEQRGAEEIGLLTDLYAFYNRTQHYSSVQNVDCMQEFYHRQINVYRAYATEEDVDQKINELYENYMKVVENKVEAPTDPVDIAIFRQSSWVWGDAADSMEDDVDLSKQETGDDDMIKDPNDSSKRETGDDDLKDPKDSSKHETGGDDMIKDPRDQPETGDPDLGSKDSYKQETGDVHDKGSDVSLKDYGGITGDDGKDSTGKSAGPSAP